MGKTEELGKIIKGIMESKVGKVSIRILMGATSIEEDNRSIRIVILRLGRVIADGIRSSIISRAVTSTEISWTAGNPTELKLSKLPKGFIKGKYSL